MLARLDPAGERPPHEWLAEVRPRERAHRRPPLRLPEHGLDRRRARRDRGPQPRPRLGDRHAAAHRAARARRRGDDRDGDPARRGLRAARLRSGPGRRAGRRTGSPPRRSPSALAARSTCRGTPASSRRPSSPCSPTRAVTRTRPASPPRSRSSASRTRRRRRRSPTSAPAASARCSARAGRRSTARCWPPASSTSCSSPSRRSSPGSPDAPRIVEGDDLPGPLLSMQLAWVLRHGDELFLRYRL